MAEESEVPKPNKEPTIPAPSQREQELERQVLEHKSTMDEVARALQDPNTVRELAKRAGISIAEAKAAIEEDDSALVDRKQLKTFADDLKKTVGGAISQVATAQGKRLAESNLKAFARDNPKAEKYLPEMKGLLERMDPHQASDLDVIQKTFKVVAADHPEDFQSEAEKKARDVLVERLHSRGYSEAEIEEALAEDEPDEVVDEEVPATRERGKEPARVVRRGTPAAETAASRASFRRQADVKPLSRDERAVCDMFGIKDADEYRRMADKNWKPDLLGSHGRSKF